MAYRVRFNDIVVEMDNLQELTDIIDALKSGAEVRSSVSFLTSRLRPKPIEVRVFQGEREIAALDSMIRSLNGVTPRQLADLLGTSPVGLRGFMSKWARRAKSSGRTLAELIERRKTYKGGKFEVTYRLTEEGRKYFGASGGVEPGH